MKKQQAKRLVNKYVSGTATPEERELLDQWFTENFKNSSYKPSEKKITAADERITAYLMNHIGVQPETKITRLWPRLAAAASVLLFVCCGTYFLLRHMIVPRQQIAKNPVHDIAPGTNQAVLTLANGKTIILSNTFKGLLAKQGTSTINVANGQLVYQQTAGNGVAGNEVTYNSITIPRGAEYEIVVLPDGTKVWINSASTLRYPTAFTGNQRSVELTGEAYFEVEHNSAKPFRVVSHNQTVEVLGTHFNINAYDDERAVKTTLLEGKVKVTATANHTVRYLAPGQQAALSTSSFTIAATEPEEEIAWKTGQFMFNGKDIQYIMRTISRWYNVDVEYSGQVPDDTFGGATSRFANVSSVLNILQLTGKVHFKVDGRKIIVSK